MIDIKLYPHQQEVVNKIYASTDKKNFIQAPTSFGKTIVFSYLANNHKGRCLILANREELIYQAEKTINGFPFILTAKTKEIEEEPTTLAMIETFNNRQKKGLIDINDFDLVIVDEAHTLEFTKVIEGYKGRLLGFSATPVTDKRLSFHKCKVCGTEYKKKTDCCGRETKEFSRKVTLSKWYGPLIQSLQIKDVIETGKIVDVRNYICDVDGLDKLKTDSSGNFTPDSEKEVFDNHTGLENLISNYEAHCKGLKTMIFNNSCASNLAAYEAFVERGYNVRMFDSISGGIAERKEVVEWFRSERDAVLMSVGVFTTGFDVKDVEAIIMNRATQSLSLYHQIVGRGGRPTDEIYKPYFKLIDLGGNVSRHGSWSDEVDWETIYNNSEEKEKRPKVDDFVICRGCGAMVRSLPCDFCGHVEKPKPKQVNKGDVVVAQEIGKLPKPKPDVILNYAKANGLDINKAKNIACDYIVEMFRSKGTSKKTFEDNYDYVKAELFTMLRPVYFILHNSELEGNRKRTINNFIDKALTKIEKYYE
jgi:superfamily II DNA or RNA helicase